MFLSNTFHQYDVLGTSKSCDRYVVFFLFFLPNSSSQSQVLNAAPNLPSSTYIYGNMQTYRYFYIYTEVTYMATSYTRKKIITDLTPFFYDQK